LSPAEPVISIDAHPSLSVAAFQTRFPSPLGAHPAPAWIHELPSAAAAGIARSEGVRQSVRDLLRVGGYKPTGRGKPSSEYLARTAEQGGLPRINAAVDVCNAVSLASGLPISVIDLDRSGPPWRIGLAGPGEEYVFNPAGQSMALEGLLCLFDAVGPCANPVKDAQRTKTGPGTTRTLSVVWAPRCEAELLARTSAWYRELLARAGAATEAVALRGP
jgi:DNA/RNA-binding domain of Phe-tRNA-synthetase-like protein